MKVLTRRQLLGTLGSAGAAVAVGCGGTATSPSTTSTASSSTTGTTTGTSSAACAVTPEETAGPYPDKTGMLGSTAFFRQDITEGRNGTAVALTLTVVNTSSACGAIANANVEIWQCDASGHYSEYSQPGYDGTGQTFLRGLQTTDANGQVTFRTIYPGWYQGRATHIHVEIYLNGASIKTTQIAFPESITAEVYSHGVYASKGQNPTSNSGDNVFADGTEHELATVTGSAAAGYTATLTIGVAV